MVNNKPQRRFGKKPTSWAGAVAMGVVMLAGVTALYSAAPPANQQIGNQATASYLDSGGVTQLATSNTVLTTVQQVGAFTLDTNTSKSAAANTTVYMPHVLTNTGNGADTFLLKSTQTASGTGISFSAIEIYADADGDGLPDSTTPLCSTVSGTACSTGFTTSSIAAGGTYRFVTAYSLAGAKSHCSAPSPGSS